MEEKVTEKKNEIFEELCGRAKYALLSKNRDLVYECYGAAKMAWKLDCISDGEFYELNRMLVTNGLNNPKAGLQ